MAFTLLLFLVISTCSNAYRLHSLKAPKASVIEDRLAVVEDKRQAEGGFLLAFHANEGKLRFQQYSKGSWSKWQDLDSPEGKTIISNPVAAHDINNLTTVFCLCDDGQVYYKIQDTDNLVEFGKWLPVGSKLPFDTGVTLNGKDTVSVLTYQNKLTIFSRSVTKASRLYWAQEVNGNWSNWVLIGGSSVSLQTDVAIAHNGFSKVFKTLGSLSKDILGRRTTPRSGVFVSSWQVVSYITAKILSIGKLVASRYIKGENTSLLVDMHHSKMHLLKLPISLSVVLLDTRLIDSLADRPIGPTKWVSWDETGYGAPETQHAPVVHAMSHSVFNGVLNVFIYGNDGYVHHIWQTTCDKVPNPWGWCTWSIWYKISNKIPESVSSNNPLSIGTNIHLGIEVFTVGKEGGLWHMWELGRGGVWNSWQQVPSPGSNIASHVSIRNDEKGWWAAYALSAADDIKVIEQNRSLSLSVSTVSFGSPVKVSWKVPVDEATNKDWIGVYPNGADNEMYIDYYYVGGGQNPLKDAIPTGSLTFKSYLPNGKYDYRYLVNKKYFDAMSSSLIGVNGTTDKEWVQVYRGIAAGLGKEGFDFEKCVKDGNHTVELFRESFAAFENNDIFKGIELLGTALMEIGKAFEDCGETDIAKALEKLATDFIECVKGHCVHFVIDIVDEILILFENVFEIYGDIRGASNSFKINAYEQGGYCIGRVVDVCISMPS